MTDPVHTLTETVTLSEAKALISAMAHEQSILLLSAPGLGKSQIVQQAAAAGPLHRILGYTDGPLVSVDFNHDSHSSVFDATLTKVVEGTLVKVCSWYDNEWGFSNRMLDTTLAWSKAP